MSDDSNNNNIIVPDGYVTTLIAYPPLFPSTLTIGKASVTLKADGSWEGDADAFLAEMKTLTTSANVAYNMPILWLVARALQQPSK